MAYQDNCPICKIVQLLDGVVGADKRSDDIDTHTFTWYMVGAMHAYESVGDFDSVRRAIRIIDVAKLLGHTEFRRSFDHSMENQQ